ncbi:hypothetical protein [Microbacterium xanthum]|uniref:hypothetical protein n=1 Tax=Microbacterium xanthum TaxID=3079794 RepID=UPI002AD5893B|nr:MULTISPECIES: hypothetical protein [unclassified Microbacterium]MDZ8172706.1 hypothetical protein [Microbacterium sp. KSW-48]MDZ8202456.1 hypothetical protein [Microbacterium sp. SSW1-59]
MQLLRGGWPSGKVHARNLEHAHALDTDGFVFRGSKPGDAASVTALVRAHLTGVPDFAYARSDGAVVVEAPGGGVVGVAVVRASLSPEQNVVVQVRALVTAPPHRNRGVASLALGVIPQVLGPDLVPQVIFGNASSAHAAFFQRNGFDVLQPGEKLDLGAHTAALVPDTPFDTWFVRSS